MGGSFRNFGFSVKQTNDGNLLATKKVVRAGKLNLKYTFEGIVDKPDSDDDYFEDDDEE